MLRSLLIAIALSLPCGCGPVGIALLAGSAGGASSTASQSEFLLVAGPSIEGDVIQLRFSQAVDPASLATGLSARTVIDDPDFPVVEDLVLRSESSADPALLRLSTGRASPIGLLARVDITLSSALRSMSGIALGNPETRTVRTRAGSLEPSGVRVSSGSLRNSYPRVQVDDSGNAVCVWLALDATTNLVMASNFDHVTGTWSSPRALGGPVTWLSNVVRVSGGAMVAFGDRDTRRVLGRRFDNVRGDWAEAVPIAIPVAGTQDDRVMLGENQRGDAVAAWLAFDSTSRDAPLAIRVAVLPAGDSTWGQVRSLTVTSGWFASIARCSLTDSGLALVAWSELDAPGTTLRIRCSRGQLGGGFEDAAELALQNGAGVATRPNPIQPRPVAVLDAVFWPSAAEHWSSTYRAPEWGDPVSAGPDFRLETGEVSASPHGTVHIVGIRHVGSTFSFSPARLKPSGELLQTAPINLGQDVDSIASFEVHVLANESALAVWTERSGTSQWAAFSIFEPGDRELGRSGTWSLPNRLPEGTSLPTSSSNASGQVLIGYQDGDHIGSRFFR